MKHILTQSNRDVSIEIISGIYKSLIPARLTEHLLQSYTMDWAYIIASAYGIYAEAIIDLVANSVGSKVSSLCHASIYLECPKAK